jgi:hypothetical protein
MNRAMPLSEAPAGVLFGDGMSFADYTGTSIPRSVLFGGAARAPRALTRPFATLLAGIALLAYLAQRRARALAAEQV